MKSGAQPLFATFIYDFSLEGGAIGNYNTGIQIPNKASIFVIGQYIDTAITSLANPVVFNLGTINSPAFLGTLNFNTPSVIGVASNFFNSVATWQAIMDNTLNIIFGIASNAITSGRISFYLKYYLFQ